HCRPRETLFPRDCSPARRPASCCPAATTEAARLPPDCRQIPVRRRHPPAKSATSSLSATHINRLHGMLVLRAVSRGAIDEITDANHSRVHADLCRWRSEEHTSELQSRGHLVCRLLLEK